MAGLEQIEIHSKSYLVRWVDAAAGHTISWSLQPHKKSINFGVFKHPGSSIGTIPRLPSSSPARSPFGEDGKTRNRNNSITSPSAKQDAGSVLEKLQALGMKSVAWIGKCEADEVSMGRYDVLEGEGGMYGMVFDNTHAKQLSKTVTFVVMTYPTDMPPKSGNQARFKVPIARQSSGSLGKSSPSLKAVDDPGEVLSPDLGQVRVAVVEQPKGKAVEPDVAREPTFHTGVLSKKRRKRNQGWARRFFSIDFTSSTLSYYKNRNSSALRGSIPLSLAAIGADSKSRHISIDSGAEIWLLRAYNAQDFEGWRAAFEKASEKPDIIPVSIGEPLRNVPSQTSAAENLDWGKAETLVGKVAGITDSVRRLAKDTDPKYAPGASGWYNGYSGSPSPLESEGTDYFDAPPRSPERPRFWARKASSGGQSPSQSNVFRRSISAQKPSTPSLAIPTPTHALTIPKQRAPSSPGPHAGHHVQEDVHERCMAVLRDLDAVVADFSSLIAQSRRRRQAGRPQAISRKSVDSTVSQEFFDAEEPVQHSLSQLLRIRGDSEADVAGREALEGGDDSGSESELDEAEESFASTAGPGQPLLFPRKPKSLAPLPLPPILRRTTLPASTTAPPSLIAFLRKNVGKDLSTISTPVSANEPLSLLQRQAETLEYSSLLDAASAIPATSPLRLLYIAAFALSPLSNSRLKERAVRKPFNPMLGETYEFLSPATADASAYRFVAEKISHRPVRVACQAESATWSFTHAPSPSQKFWGKSAEITTSGKARVVLFPPSSPSSPDEKDASTYSWLPATAFLRNIIAGEKYIEPVSTMTVHEESSGRKAVATFKAGGMFSGRSEDVTVVAFSPTGASLTPSLTGKWTTSLHLSGGDNDGREVWRAGALVPDPGRRYGFTAFAAGLNEVTALERVDGGAMAVPPTDARLRPDQRAYEEGDVEGAEKLKTRLEEAQRRRRREMEGSGEVWEPRWFGRVGVVAGGEGDGEEVWALKGEGVGEEGDYWSVREAVVGFKGGRWDGVREVFELD